MPESGGATTNSGILYQNSIAARYLGRMLSPLALPPAEQVTAVRGEAPQHVDDVVVTFADGHRLFIQAKENIAPGSEAWKKLWLDFARQRAGPDFQPGDRLVLFLGNTIPNKKSLEELCGRARGATDSVEWLARLQVSRALPAEKEKLAGLLPAEYRGDESLWRLLGAVDIRVEGLTALVENALPWMPPSSVNNKVLFTTLRDLSGEAARLRGEFRAPALRRRLANEYGIRLDEPGEPGAGVVAAPARTWLRLAPRQPNAGFEPFESRTGRMAVGRDPEGEAALPPDAPGVSWTHGLILLVRDGYIYRHLSGSQTTTLIRTDGSSRLFQPREVVEVELRQNDRLLIGGYEFVVSYNITVDPNVLYTPTDGPISEAPAGGAAPEPPA